MGEERWEGVSDSLVDSVPSLRPGSPGLRVSGSPGLRVSGSPGLRVSGSPGLRVSGSPGLRVSVYIVRGLSVCARIPLIAGDSMLAIWNLKLTRALRKRNFTSSPPLTMQTPWVQGPVRNPLSYLPTSSHQADNMGPRPIAQSTKLSPHLVSPCRHRFDVFPPVFSFFPLCLFSILNTSCSCRTWQFLDVSP